MSSVILEKVSKKFVNKDRDTLVIHELSAQFSDGEFVVVVGPSGCGKSTLLRLIAGLEVMTSGNIYIGEQLVNDLNPAKRDIAMVFQNYALYPHMSVFDNMAYGLKIAGKSKQEIMDSIGKVAKMLELTELLQRKPHQLSGGQRQRVAMGRAIVRRPKVFLFDEPLSNLDAKLRAQTRLEIQALHNDLKVTSLFVTHDQAEALALAQRILVLNAGKIEQFGTPEEVYSRPQSTFVASFIGSPAMNLLRSVPGIDPHLVFGIRPEHCQISQDETVDGCTRIGQAKVIAVENLGCEWLLHTKIFDQDLRIRTSASLAPPSIGTTASIQIQPNQVLLFDAKTGLLKTAPTF